MSAEWVGPTPQEILLGMFQAGRTVEQLVYGFDLINKGLNEGEIKAKISCWDNVKGFFEMADRFYVKNGGVMLSDAQLGIHIGQCKSPLCRRLSQSYFEVLRPSDEADSERIAHQLRKLAKDILLGKARTDLEGRKSMYYDSQTGEDLFEAKVVDITDKCIVDQETDRQMRGFTEGEREVLLAYVPYSQGMLCDIKENYGGLGTSQAFNVEKLSPDDEAFRIRASIIGIDPELFQAIIIANKPQTELLK